MRGTSVPKKESIQELGRLRKAWQTTMMPWHTFLTYLTTLFISTIPHSVVILSKTVF